MGFSREELQVIFHALCLAESYYKDPNRSVEGMVAPDTDLVKSRLADITPIVEKIMAKAEELK